MESAVGVGLVAIFVVTQLFIFGVVAYALYHMTPSIKRELQRQQDLHAREVAKLPELPPFLQSSRYRISMLALASFAGWPLALVAWSAGGWLGGAAAVIFAVLIAMAMNHELTTFRQKVQQVRSDIVRDSIPGKGNKV